MFQKSIAFENAIESDAQFLRLHSTPFLYGKTFFGVLYLLRASSTTFDTQAQGWPNRNFNSARVIKSLYSVREFLLHPLRRYSYVHGSRANDLSSSVYRRRVPKSLARIERETVHSLCTCNYISITDEVEINEQNKSIGTGPLPRNQVLKRFNHSCRKLWRVQGYRTL